MSSDDLSKLPWESALFGRVSQLEAELADARGEIAELQAMNSQLHSKLLKARSWARTKTANWKLRQQAWQDERRELLRKLEDFSSSSGQEKRPPSRREEKAWPNLS